MGRDALFRTLAHALLLLASEGPALLVVEDLHLADASTLEFFRYFAPRTRVHRLQMLSTCRTVAEGDVLSLADQPGSPALCKPSWTTCTALAVQQELRWVVLPLKTQTP